MSTTHTNDGLVRIVVIVLGVLILFPLLVMIFAMPVMGMMGWWGVGMMDGVSPLWGFGMLLVWLVVLLAVGYVIYRVLVGQVAPESGADPALEELRMAYARGDLTDEEFEERRRNLQRTE